MHAVDELKKQNEDLKSFALHIKEKNDLIEEFKQVINKLEKDVDTDIRIKNQDELINMRIIKEGDWSKFKILFNSVYSNFMKKLLNKFPNLTEGEKRQILLLKLGFSLNQTADVLGISYNSVKKARQRLAKKINLNNAEMLNNFFKHF